MPGLTNEDKLSILKRLVKRIKSWRLQKSLPAVLFFGKPGLSRSSPEFERWLEDAKKAIGLVFGEYSHWLAEFNDIEYVEILSALKGDTKANEAHFWAGLDQAQTLIESMIADIHSQSSTPGTVPRRSENIALGSEKPCVFIGHGHNSVWLRVQKFLEQEIGLTTVSFESESHASESVVPILEGMLNRAHFAVVILTAEDATAEGQLRARQNVIHEAGLAQGKLGFSKVVILRQEGVEELTNLAGLQHISFNDRIEHAFYDLGRVLKREGLN